MIKNHASILFAAAGKIPLLSAAVLFCSLAVSGCMILPNAVQDELLLPSPEQPNYYSKNQPPEND